MSGKSDKQHDLKTSDMGISNLSGKGMACAAKIRQKRHSVILDFFSHVEIVIRYEDSKCQKLGCFSMENTAKE